MHGHCGLQLLFHRKTPRARPIQFVTALTAVCCTACLAAAATAVYRGLRLPSAADDGSHSDIGGRVLKGDRVEQPLSITIRSRAETLQPLEFVSAESSATVPTWHDTYVTYRQEHDRRLGRLNYVHRGSSTSNDSQHKCDVIPPGLVGSIPVNLCPVRLADLEGLDFALVAGGHFEPSYCRPRSLVAIVIPFRARWEHLARWLLHMHPFLQRQELGYTIYVINQEEGSLFNRGLLMNVGYNEARKARRYDCFIFHDVDLLPEDDRNLYSCPFAPRHMSVAIDKFGYSLPYADIAGGAIAISTNDFEKLNGFSNLFFGWGGEDDDFSFRIQASGIRLTRYKHSIARYKMIKHVIDSGNEVNEQRYELLKSSKERQPVDGLNTLSYAVKNVQFRKLFTWISVAVNQDAISSRHL